MAGKCPAALKTERTRIEGESRIVEADLGPVRYLAALIGAGDESVLPYFVVAGALLFDPLSCFCQPQHGGRNHDAP